MNTAYRQSPEACVRALYEVISGPPEQARDWAHFRQLCRSDARFLLATAGPDGAPLTQCWDVEGFIAEGTQQFATHGLWEAELVGRIERFGRVAHVFSSYTSRLDDPDAAVISRGVNSIQLVWEPTDDLAGGRWLIVHLIWDRERAGVRLPPELEGAAGKGAA